MADVSDLKLTETKNENGISVVHESEAQRQFARIKIPAKVCIDNIELDVVDLSAGGLSLSNENNQLAENNFYKGKLVITIDGFDFAYPVSFTTLTQMPNQNIGCTFQNVTKQFTNAMRYIITAFLGGELISTGDLVTTLSRDNHTSIRKKKQLPQSSTGERLKSVSGSLTLLGVGVAAFSYVAIQLINIYAVETSTQAFVNTNSQFLAMPQDGSIELMIKPDTQKVTKGQIVATYSLNNLNINQQNLPTETKDALSSMEQIGLMNTGTIISPCDCDVVNTSVIDGQFLQKGQHLFTLMPEDNETFIAANFTFKDGESLKIGQAASFKIFGTHDYYQGVVDKIKISEDGLSIQTVIKPTQALPLDDYEKPAKVVLAPSLISNTIISWL